MPRRILNRLSLSIEILALAAAAAIVVSGGWRGSLLGIGMSARGADRPLFVFSILFLLRSWWGGEAAIENRAIGAVWRAVGGSKAGGALRMVATAAASWAALGASAGLAEDAGLIAGHRYLLPNMSIAIVSLVCATLIYAAAASLAAPAALIVAWIPTFRGQGAGRGSLALFPLAATVVLSGGRPVWSLPPGGPGARAAGAAMILTLVLSPVLFAGLLPAAVRRLARRPLVSVAGLTVITLAGISLIAHFAALPAPPADPSSAGTALPARPNIVLVTIDTLRADRIGCYGSDHVRTPRIDALAASGVRFDQTVCQIPETGPSHASILNGLYPQSHGSRTNGEHPLESPDIPGILRARGYRTAAFVSGYPLKARLAGLDRNFDTYDDSFSRFETLPGLAIVSRSEALGLLSYTDLWSIWAERRADVTNAAVIRWLRESSAGADPFFLWVHYYDPHGPYDPPEPYARTYYQGNERDPASHSMDNVRIPHRHQEKPGVTDVNFYVAQYEGEVSWTDSQVGVLFDEIATLGLSGRTVVVLTADHGESLVDHGYWFAHGDVLYESSIRVPLIFAGPGIARGVVFGGQTQSVDIAPTILDLLGLSAPSAGKMDGRSLLPVLRNGEALPPGDAFVETNIIPERDGQPTGDPVAAKARAIRSAGYKFISTPGSGDALYDLALDPGEERDGAAASPDLAAEMRARLTGWLALAPAEKEASPLSAGERELLESLGYVGR